LPQANIRVLLTLTLEDGMVLDGSLSSDASPDTGDGAGMTDIALLFVMVCLFAFSFNCRLGF
jgi:hypothetical protein